MYLCVRGIDVSSFYNLFLLDFGSVSTVWFLISMTIYSGVGDLILWIQKSYGVYTGKQTNTHLSYTV
jgi:hypothetical protein